MLRSFAISPVKTASDSTGSSKSADSFSALKQKTETICCWQTASVFSIGFSGVNGLSQQMLGKDSDAHEKQNNAAEEFCF